MSIGAGIVLIAIGAILAFAVDVTVSGLDIAIVGWILMAAGAAGLVIGLVTMNNRRSGRTAVVEERTYRDDRP